MERSLFRFIWKFSAREQIKLLAFTLLSFPFLYMTLELPKRIINDAIGAEGGAAEPAAVLLGRPVDQIELLAVLCAGFLAAVLASGLMKMRINTMKGILAERLLRRFRYQLIHRILRFPLPHFRRVSQGELIPMVTSEAEPLGGVMGDALAQPVFQAGQMITIMTFLFVQNVWLGLAAVALIPLQAWLIPRLQRRINLLQKERVQEVRRLSDRIGESVAGIEDLRVNGGVRRTLADFTGRLGRLFEIRYRIYRQKFFMKFLNNFITQLTPFFFFSIGGYLAIKGELTVGALVAALAAYKDLSGPWKELLTYYNQVQDMSLRYDTIIEQFAPEGILGDRLLDPPKGEPPHLSGPIRLGNVTVREPDGTPVIDSLTAELPPRAMVAVKAGSAQTRRAFAQLMTRELAPSSGQVTIDGTPLADVAQATIAARVGYAGHRPYLFSGTIGDNIMMPLRVRPRGTVTGEDRDEAIRTGNSTDPGEGEWLDTSLAGTSEGDGLRDWWARIVGAIGTDEFLFRRGIDARLDPTERAALADRLVALRPAMAERLAAEGLEDAIWRFDPERFNPGLAVGGNLLFATPRRVIRPAEFISDPDGLPALDELRLRPDLVAVGSGMLRMLHSTFGEVGVEHPLFRRLGIEGAHFERLCAIEEKRCAKGFDALAEVERALVLCLPFQMSAEQIGPGFPDGLKSKILDLRRSRGADLRKRTARLFAPLAQDSYAEGLTVLENLVFGRVRAESNGGASRLRDIAAEVLIEAGLRSDIAFLIGDVETSAGGTNLAPVAHERIAFVRAAIKRPDILVLDRALSSHSPEDRMATRRKLRDLLPDTTIIFLEEDFRRPQDFDLVIDLDRGVETEGAPGTTPDAGASADLRKKMKILSKVALFSDLDPSQLRLLAFASRWFEAEAGAYIFRRGDTPTGAYLLMEGQAELHWPDMQEGEDPVTAVDPGRLIGDMSVIQGSPRVFDMVAITPVKGLKIGAEELMDVIRSDADVAVSLLRTVSGYLSDVAFRLRDTRLRDARAMEDTLEG